MLICGMHGRGNVANGGCSDIEYRTHFALWCLFQSPLMIGSDLSTLDDVNLALYKNKELIAIDQDPEARPPFMVNEDRERPIFFKHLAHNEIALAFFNFTDHDSDGGWGAACQFYDFGLPVASGYGLHMHDIFTGEDLGVKSEYMNVPLKAHDCKIFRCTLEAR